MVEADTTDYPAVDSFASALDTRLDYLVLNAGIYRDDLQGCEILLEDRSDAQAYG